MNELNARPELCLDVNCDSEGWSARSGQQIVKQLFNAEQVVGPKELQTFSASFTNEASIEAYLGLYQSILSNGGAPR